MTNIDSKDEKGFTALMIAVSEERTEIIKLILDEKVNINAQDNRGFTVLMIAVLNEFEDIVSLLLKKNVDLTIKHKEGKSLKDNLLSFTDNENIIKMIRQYNRTEQDGGYYEYKRIKDKYRILKKKLNIYNLKIV
jgi:ankyrin repeat protein